MGVPRGTTPTFTLTLDDEDLDLTTAQTVIVSFSNREACLEKQGSDITVRQNEIDVFLSQEETLAFLEKRVDIQVNWILVGGILCASTITSYTFGRQPTGAQDAYMSGDKVHYPDEDGTVYESTIDYNVYRPGVYGWVIVS